MIPSTVPATPVSLAQVGREFLTVLTDVVDALEHDLASRVADTQLDAPSFVHATQFDALQGDIDGDEEALPADPPPVIHHTMFSPSDPETESEGGPHPISGVRSARRRLVLVSNANRHQVEGGDSHDERLARVRESLQRGNVVDRGVRKAIGMVTSLASRIGPVRDDQGVPRPIFEAAVVCVQRAIDVGRSSR